MKKILAFMLVTAIAAGTCTNALATRRRQVLNAESLEGTEEETGGISWGDIYYSDGLPGPDDDFDFSGYNYNGVPLDIQDTSKMTNFSADEITNFSDALVDYMGWEAAWGSLFYDFDENMLTFKADGTGTADIGYSKKMFGDGTIKFQARFHDDTGTAWLGLAVRCDDLQYAPWSGMNCYLVVIKANQVEIQKYFPSQEMLLVQEYNALKLETWQTIEFENTKQDDGMHLRLVIDGEEIFSYIDSEAPFAPDEGYVNLHWAKTLDLKPTDATISHGNVGTEREVLALKAEKNTAYADGKTVAIDVENEAIAPYIKNDRMFVPLRFVSENLGMEVTWEKETQTVILEKNGHKMTLSPGFAEYTFDGALYTMDTSAEITGSRTFVPIRFVTEAFSKNVVWEDGTVFITSSQEDINEEVKEKVKEAWKEN